MRRLPTFVAFCLSLFVSPAVAADRSWDGEAGTTSWEDAANWTDDTVPVADDVVMVGDLPAGAGALVELAATSSARRLVLTAAAEVDTNGQSLSLGGNAVVQGGSLLRAEGDGSLTATTLDVFNILLRSGSTLEMSGALVEIGTAGAGVGSIGTVDIDAGTTLLSAGSGRVVFNDDLAGGEATLFNNNGTLRVTQPAAPDPGVSYTLRIESTDAGAVADLDGDGDTGVIDLGDFAVLNVFTKTAPFSSTADLADNAQLLFSQDVAFGSTAVVNFNGAAGGSGAVTNRLRSDGTLTADAGSALNINSGVTEIRGEFAAAAGSQINVADSTTIAFDAPPVGDGSVRTNVLGELNLGSASKVSVDGDVFLGNGQFDWDGAENAETVVNAGGRLTIEADTIESTAGDDTFNGRIEVFGGATADGSASVRTDITQGWRLAGSMQLAGTPVDDGFTANFLNSSDNTFTIDPVGVVTLVGGSIGSQSNGFIVNEGVIEGNGLISAEGFSNNGLIRAIAGDNGEVLRTTLARNFDLDGNDQVNPGDVEAIEGDIAIQGRLTDNFGGVATIGSGRTIDFQIGWILGGPATLNLTGGAEAATVDSSGIDNGGMNQQNGVSVLRGTINVTNTGRILGDAEFRSTATVNLTDSLGRLELGDENEVQAGVTFVADGEVVNLSGGALTLGDGVDFADAQLVNDGQLLLEGDAAGASFVQSATGETVLGIGGVLESEYDQLAFDTIDGLAGLLTIELTGGFVPADGDAFSVLSGALGGAEFDTLQLPALPGDLDWVVDYQATALVLSVETDGGGDPLPGDYNGDGMVDAADFTVWRDTLDSLVDLRADGDGDGAVDPDDYDIWVANFGASGSAAAVPEPAAWAAALALSTFATRRRSL